MCFQEGNCRCTNGLHETTTEPSERSVGQERKQCSGDVGAWETGGGADNHAPDVFARYAAVRNASRRPSRRTREIGIRAALGAAPRRIVTSVLSRAFAQIGAGVLAGA